MLTSILLMTLLVSPVLAKGGSGTRDANVPPPNIVVIMTDDQDLTMDSLAYMPRLNRLLAAQGMSFERFYVPQALCCPSRVTFLRGQYPHNHQVYTNLPPLGSFEKAYSLGLENATIATALHDAGYRTALLGKYLNGYPLSDYPTYIPPGWDRWFSPTTSSTYGSYSYTVNDNGTLVSYGSSRADYITDVLAGKALDFITSAAEEDNRAPFFLYLTFYAPHSPANPAQRHATLFPNAQVPRTVSFNEGDISDKPSFMQIRPSLTVTETREMDTLYRNRLRSLQAVDEAIEALVNRLQQNGQLDNTYLFFLSDNGFHLGQHRLPAGKGSPYEEDVHLPLLVRGPGVAAGVTRAELASMIDLAPTLADLAGTQLSYDPDGRSLASLLHTTAPPAQWRQTLLIEAYTDPVLAMPTRPASWESFDPMDLLVPQFAYTALHTGSYIYIERAGTSRELYNLLTDPEQVYNRWNDAPAAMRSQLTAYLGALRTCVAGTCRSADLPAPPAYQVAPSRRYLPALHRVNLR